MTNKEKLEIIDKALNVCYETINIDFHKMIPREKATDFKEITQAIYNLESTKLLLEPISNTPTIYECANCGKQIECYGEFINGECLSCGYGFVKKEH